mmetsp:Transcript_61646/g.74163  ORF Transcript_61646/g.74163 Transcript_61646/m.74163 type:complete len:105 (-) Transcript_61646:25-339(-)
MTNIKFSITQLPNVPSPSPTPKQPTWSQRPSCPSFPSPNIERCRHQGREEEILESKKLNITEFSKNAHKSNFLHHHQPTHICHHLPPNNHLNLNLQRKSSASQK